MLKKLLFVVAGITAFSACTGIPSKISPQQMQPLEQASVSQATSIDVPPTTLTAKVEGKKYIKICKTYATTGTRFENKICRSQEAWDELERKAKDALYYGTKPHSNNASGG